MATFLDETRDLSECPGDDVCTADKGPYGMTYAHRHCEIHGAVMMAEGGGGDDGRSIGGYEWCPQCVATERAA